MYKNIITCFPWNISCHFFGGVIKLSKFYCLTTRNRKQAFYKDFAYPEVNFQLFHRVNSPLKQNCPGLPLFHPYLKPWTISCNLIPLDITLATAQAAPRTGMFYFKIINFSLYISAASPRAGWSTIFSFSPFKCITFRKWVWGRGHLGDSAGWASGFGFWLWSWVTI